MAGVVTSSSMIGHFKGEITGDGVALEFVVTHNLGNKQIFVAVYDFAGDQAEVIVDKERTSNDTTTIIFAVAPANLVKYHVYIQSIIP